IRSSAAQVRVTGRNAQGVKLVQLDDGDMVPAVARGVPEDEEGAGDEGEEVDMDAAVAGGSEFEESLDPALEAGPGGTTVAFRAGLQSGAAWPGNGAPCRLPVAP